MLSVRAMLASVASKGSMSPPEDTERHLQNFTPAAWSLGVSRDN